MTDRAHFSAPSTPTVVFEDSAWQRLLPLVYFRAVYELRCGMGTLLERLQRRVASDAASAVSGAWCRPVLAGLVTERTGLPCNAPLDPQAGTLLLNGRGLWRRVPRCERERPADPAADGAVSSWVGMAGETIVAIATDSALAQRLTPDVLIDELRLQAALAGLPRRDLSDCVQVVDWPWQLVLANGEALREDWSECAAGGELAGRVGPGAYLLNETAIRVGHGSRIKPCAVIDAEDGPVWIGRNVTILPHCYVQGPAWIGEGSLLQPGAIVHAGTAIGPRCKVGGEIESSIIQGFSNKQHDGFLGHSYIGSWVNIAADCINSDLKNTYGEVRVPINGREINSGEMFVGMFMGDFSKAGINVSFPTGAVIGFCSSVFAPRSPKFVPSFAWLDGTQADRLDIERGLEVAGKVMARRQHILTEHEEAVFRSVRRQALAIELQPQMAIELGSR